MNSSTEQRNAVFYLGNGLRDGSHFVLSINEEKDCCIIVVLKK